MGVQHSRGSGIRIREEGSALVGDEDGVGTGEKGYAIRITQLSAWHAEHSRWRSMTGNVVVLMVLMIPAGRQVAPIDCLSSNL